MGEEAERPYASGGQPNPTKYLAIHIAITKKTPLFGYNTRSGKLERIDPGILNSCTFSDDATKLYRSDKDTPIYEGLAIERKGFKQVLKNLEDTWPVENS